jgi:hypothetical protein
VDRTIKPAKGTIAFLKQEVDLYKQKEDRLRESLETKEKEHKEREKLLKEKADNAEKERVKLASDLAKWQAAYEEQRLRSARIESEGERDYHLRLLAEKKAREECSQMSAQVFSLRSAIEEDRVPEARLMGDFAELCGKINNCMNFLKFRLPEDRQSCLEDLRPEFGFDTSTTIQLPFIDHVVARKLIELVLQEAEGDFMCGMSHWSRVMYDPACKTTNVEAYRNAEEDMQARIVKLAHSEEDPLVSRNSRKQKMRDDSRGK